MEKIVKVTTANRVSEVIIGSAEKELPRLLEGRKMVIVITDTNIKRLYPEFIGSFKHIVLETGEENKRLSALEPVYSALLEMGADRHTTIVGIGGGIVTDMTGFIASTYQRGVDFGFVATTLLSQVDASVGGKNGVNHDGFKNMIGVFNQPRFVVCDTSMLSTLPEREFRSGLSEIIKAGVIKSGSLFEKFEKNSFNNFLNGKSLLEEVLFESIEIKARVVEEDEREKGERKKLNFGHTVAHAIEKSTREFNHGEAVAIGMIYASKIGVKCGKTSQELCNRVTKVVENCGFKMECNIDDKTLFQALKSDKKRNNDSIDFILPTKAGEAEIVSFSFEKLEKIF